MNMIVGCRAINWLLRMAVAVAKAEEVINDIN